MKIGASMKTLVPETTWSRVEKVIFLSQNLKNLLRVQRQSAQLASTALVALSRCSRSALPAGTSLAIGLPRRVITMVSPP